MPRDPRLAFAHVSMSVIYPRITMSRCSTYNSGLGWLPYLWVGPLLFFKYLVECSLMFPYCPDMQPTTVCPTFRTRIKNGLSQQVDTHMQAFLSMGEGSKSLSDLRLQVTFGRRDLRGWLLLSSWGACLPGAAGGLRVRVVLGPGDR